MADYSVVAKRLKEARMRACLSQKQLGIKAGMDEFSASARVNQYERGKHTPDYSTVERIAKVLRVPTPYFYAREDELAKLILTFRASTRQRPRPRK
jgi:transcriptional regulator with XRE-family HTH domain